MDNGDGGRCLCYDPGSQMPLWSRHVRHCPPTSKDRRALIGTRRRMCASFWHGRECVELGNPKLCVVEQPGVRRCDMLTDDERCPKNVCVMVARLQAATGLEKMLARYTNCYRGASVATVHTERMMIEDDTFQTLIEPGDTLTLYITYQPCHHNGGGKMFEGHHTTSCTLRLLTWYCSVLQPRGITLHVRCSDLFRAAWSPGVSVERYGLFNARRYNDRARLAHKGLQMLTLEAGLSINGLNDDDWDFLWSLAHCQDLFTAEEHAARARFDTNIRNFIQQLRQRPRPPPPPPPPCGLDDQPPHSAR